MAFLGETAPERAGAAEAAGRRAAAGAAPFAARLSGLGRFPGVLWAGLADPAPAEALAEGLRRELAAEGFPLEDRPFEAHVTLARGRKAKGPVEDRWSGTEFTVSELVFFESRLSSAGARHEARARIPLGRPA